MARPTQVCLFTETYYPVIGGGERQAEALANNLEAQGVEVIVLTRRTDRRHAAIEKSGKITVCRILPWGSNRLAKWALLLTVPIALLRLRHRFELLFVSGFHLSGMFAVPVAKILRKPCVLKADSLGEFSGSYFASGLERIGLKPSSPLLRAFFRLRNRIVKQASAYVAISSAVAEELLALGIPRGALHPIPNSVCIDRFRPVDSRSKRVLRRRLNLRPEDLVVVYTGRLVSYKGLPVLVRAWAGVLRSYPRSLLLLVGSGGLDIHNCENELKSSVVDLGIENAVRFTGNVDDPHHYLQASDLFVFPTENEAFGVSLIEAMACGLPVIATQVGGLRDYVEHRRNAWVIEAGNVSDLEESIKRLLGNQQLRIALGKEARKAVEMRFSSKEIGRKYLLLFGGLASGGQG